VKDEIEIDKESQKAIDKAVIKSLFKMLYKEDLVDREEYEKLLECTDRKFEDIDYLYAKRKEPKNPKK
jgi:BMFP domain-containing protein YqiC